MNCPICLEETNICTKQGQPYHYFTYFGKGIFNLRYGDITVIVGFDATDIYFGDVLTGEFVSILEQITPERAFELAKEYEKNSVLL